MKKILAGGVLLGVALLWGAAMVLAVLLLLTPLALVAFGGFLLTTHVVFGLLVLLWVPLFVSFAYGGLARVKVLWSWRPKWSDWAVVESRLFSTMR